MTKENNKAKQPTPKVNKVPRVNSREESRGLKEILKDDKLAAKEELDALLKEFVELISEDQRSEPSLMRRKNANFFGRMKYDLLSFWYGDQAKSTSTITFENKKIAETGDSIACNLEIGTCIGAVYGGHPSQREIIRKCNTFLSQKLPILIGEMHEYLNNDDDLKNRHMVSGKMRKKGSNK
jgi:hypothetical protein